MSGIEFTPANLQGTYALSIIGEGGEAPFAAVGLLAFDGAGGVSVRGWSLTCRTVRPARSRRAGWV